MTGSPDYNSAGYQERLKNLHDFSQAKGVGYFGNDNICGYSISDNACGVMALYAGFYMFSGQGWNDQTVFDGFKTAATADGYFGCTGSDFPGESYEAYFGSNLEAYTNMHKEVQWDGPPSWDALVEELKKGRKIITETADGSVSVFTHGRGHYELVDHYNAEKDMIFVFDSALDETTTMSKFSSWMSSSEYEYDSANPRNGVYISRQVVERYMAINHAASFSYDGCWNGGTASNVCRNVSGGGNGLKEGGMSYDEAVTFMTKYRNEASKKLKGNYGLGQQNGTVIGDGFVNDAGCKDGALNNCSAFTQWFINNYTTIGPNFGSTSGSKYTDLLISEGGFEDGGQVPQVYAVFSCGCGDGAGDACISSVTGKSYNNHTGIILGIDKEKGLVYTGEAGCSAGFDDSWPGVFTRKLDDMTNTGENGYKYAYPGNKIKLGNGTYFGPAQIEEFNKKWESLGEQNYDELKKLAKSKGISDDNFVAMVAWARIENYENEPSYGPYFAYLCNSVGYNNALAYSKKGQNSGYLNLMEGWGYDYVNARRFGSSTVANSSNDYYGHYPSNLKSVRMALDYPYPNIYGCSGRPQWGGGYNAGVDTPIYDPKGTDGTGGDSLIFDGTSP